MTVTAGYLVPATQASEHDEFATLAGTLFGDDFDAEGAWSVAKMGPDSADLHVPGGVLRPTKRRRVRKAMTPEQKKQRTEARIGLASNYLGLAAGTAGTVAAARNPALRKKTRTAEHAGPVTRRLGANRWLKAHRGKLYLAGAGGALGLQVANVGGDVVANRVLGRASKADVGKAGTHPPLKEVVRGMRQVQRNINAAPAGRHLGPTDTRTMGQKVMGVPRPTTKVPVGTPLPAGSGGHRRPVAGKRRTAESRNALRSAAHTTLSSRKRQAATGSAVVGGGLGLEETRQRRPRYLDMEQAYYGKADSGHDVTWAGTFSKLDDEQHLAFGWATVVELDGQPVVDRQGDYISPEDIEKAAYAYVHNSRVGGNMHARTEDSQVHKVSDLVESVVFTDEKIEKMGLPDDFPRGWWVGFKIHDPESWEMVKKRERTGFSIHGRGLRKDMDVDELMYGRAR